MFPRSAPFVLAFLLLAAAVAAQVPPIPPGPPAAPSSATVDVRVQDAQVSVSLDKAGTTEVIVTNMADSNPLNPALDTPRRVNLDVAGMPEGWTVSISPNSFQLGPQQSGKAVLTIAVSSAATATVANLNVTALLYPLGDNVVPGASPTVDPEARDSARVTATRHDSLARTVTEQVGPYIFLLLGALALAVIAVALLMVLRGRAAVRLACEDGEIVVAPGGKAVFPITVTNISGRDDGVALRVTVPEWWESAFSKSQFELPANSEANITLTVRVPKNARPGDRHEVAVVVVSALPRKASGIRLVVRVRD